MQRIILLVIIYAGFISLGLPDSILGVAWPDMRLYFSRSLSEAGILVLITTLATTFSSFTSGYFINRIGTGVLLTLSCFLTASALLGYAISQNWLMLLFFTLPLGIGAGAIDSALNHYVAINYSSRHMNWLHGCWGIGTTLGPLIMTYVLAINKGWQLGYIIISIIQFFLAFTFLFTLKQWKKEAKPLNQTNSRMPSVLNSKISWLAVLMFFFYTGIETNIGLWTFSLFVEYRDTAKEIAGLWISMYWASLTLGRFITGALSNHFNNKFFIKWGLIGAFAGIIMISFSNNNLIPFLGLVITGFSLAPIYPSMMNETPKRFNKEKTSILIGYQIGAASLGIAILPALLGWLASFTTLEILPAILGCFIIIMITMNVLLSRYTRNNVII